MWETIITTAGMMWLKTEDGEWINMAHVKRLHIVELDTEERYGVVADTIYRINTYKTKAEAEHAIERILNPE